MKGCKGDYCVAWLARTFLLCRVRAAGIQHLPLHGVGVKSLAKAGPDQCSWVARMTRTSGGLGRLTVAELFRKVCYTGSPELFSMWACLCGSIDYKTVSGREEHLRKLCASFHAKHGWYPHPAVLTTMDSV